jgi:hypothetical protein
VETGALDVPGLQSTLEGTAASALGYVFDAFVTNKQLKMWKQELLYIQATLGVLKDPQPAPGLIDGKWGWKDKLYILQNICGALPSNVSYICR